MRSGAGCAGRRGNSSGSLGGRGGMTRCSRSRSRSRSLCLSRRWLVQFSRRRHDNRRRDDRNGRSRRRRCHGLLNLHPLVVMFRPSLQRNWSTRQCSLYLHLSVFVRDQIDSFTALGCLHLGVCQMGLGLVEHVNVYRRQTAFTACLLRPLDSPLHRRASGYFNYVFCVFFVRGVARRLQRSRFCFEIALYTIAIKTRRSIARIRREKFLAITQTFKHRRIHAERSRNPILATVFPLLLDSKGARLTMPRGISLDVEDVIRPLQNALSPARFLRRLRENQFPRATRLVSELSGRAIQTLDKFQFVVVRIFLSVCHDLVFSPLKYRAMLFGLRHANPIAAFEPNYVHLVTERMHCANRMRGQIDGQQN